MGYSRLREQVGKRSEGEIHGSFNRRLDVWLADTLKLDLGKVDVVILRGAQAGTLRARGGIRRELGRTLPRVEVLGNLI